MYKIRILTRMPTRKTFRTNSLTVAIIYICLLNKYGYAVSLKRVKE